MQLYRRIIIYAFQSDCRMIGGYLRMPVLGGEFRAFSPVMLWTLPIVLLSKAFSLFCCSVLSRLQMLLIFPQAESLIYHNLGHRPRSGQRPGTEQQKKKKQI